MYFRGRNNQLVYTEDRMDTLMHSADNTATEEDKDDAKLRYEIKTKLMQRYPGGYSSLSMQEKAEADMITPMGAHMWGIYNSPDEDNSTLFSGFIRHKIEEAFKQAKAAQATEDTETKSSLPRPGMNRSESS